MEEATTATSQGATQQKGPYLGLDLPPSDILVITTEMHLMGIEVLGTRRWQAQLSCETIQTTTFVIHLKHLLFWPE